MGEPTTGEHPAIDAAPATLQIHTFPADGWRPRFEVSIHTGDCLGVDEARELGECLPRLVAIADHVAAQWVAGQSSGGDQ
ncbi:MAG: hypothetical protein ACRD03_02850 [Acidimicrobiales bacterium]